MEQRPKEREARYPQPQAWSEAVRSTDSPERESFLESHVGLVRYLALRIASRLPSVVDADDLVHDGIVGLLDAATKYDPSRGVLFRTYAEARIRGAILDGLRQKDWRPRSVRRTQREIDEAIGRLTSHSGMAVDEEEIASAMGLDLSGYRSALQDSAAGPMLSLEDLPAGADPATSAEGSLPHAALERRELVDALADEVTRLPERERRVIELYYHEGLNMKEVGAVLGVTESRVCQLHSQAAARLRVALKGRLHAAGVKDRHAVATGARR
jgi:RNA polymerase sigma factor for flagellar operon FliA